MAKQLNVNLAFTADTGKAKAQLQELQQSLSNLINLTAKSTSEFGLTKELAQATSEATKLKAMLESATNSTGTLDLGQFNQALQKSGKTLTDYASTLQSLGPKGSETFVQLAKAISSANVPLKQTNKLLDEFATTMKNTVRWQFSSSMLHGFMGAVQSAYGYAQDLNESLNNIRIVTGYNIDQMDAFAEKANKAAQALSTTTTEYTNASLIYYQQGLSESEVEQRTAVTIKMANAAGQSAEVVSDQLTAIWNNFYDGSKSLEYYADVMTALGAATASSTDEIAGGLEKFAAIGETIGLSYEYAASALATITSNTRQSEEVVGTALKTIFARIQGLNLGETLDDGTTLNKYSEALQSVGISIFDSAGEMKKMDDILDEMASKWDTLSKAQQAALAQTVAGTRQYTQLVALMDNWNNGDMDSMTANLETAYNATGALQEQADIYAESWEAARDRVTAAAEGIYNQLIDDKFFIDLNNTFAKLLNTVGGLIDGLGGLPGVLSVISTWMLQAFGKDIAASIERTFYNIKIGSEQGRKEILELRQEANQNLANMYDDGSISGSAQVETYKQQAGLQERILAKTLELESANKTLSNEEERQMQMLLEVNEALGNQYINIAKNREEQEKTTATLIEQASIMVNSANKTSGKEEGNTPLEGFDEQLKSVKDLQIAYKMGTTLVNNYKKSVKKAMDAGGIKTQSKAFEMIKKNIEGIKKSADETGVTIDKRLVDALDEIEDIEFKDGQFIDKKTGKQVEDLEAMFNRLGETVRDIGTDSYSGFEQLRQSVQATGANMSKMNPILDKIWESFSQTGKLTADQIQTFANLGIQVDEAGNIVDKFQGKVYTTADSMVALANVVTAFSTVWNSLKGLGDIWTDEDLSYGEKVLNTLTTLATVVPTVMNAYKSWNSVKLSGISNDILALAIQQQKNIADGKSIPIHFTENGLQALENKQLTAEIVLKTILNALDLKKIAIYTALAIAIGAVVAVGKLLYDAYHQDAEAAKEANEQAQLMAERYQEAEAAAQSLKETISNWDDAVKALEELDHNTQEYADALDEANKKAKELIETYGLWNDYHLEDGVIKFNDGVLERIQNEANAEVNKAEQEHYQAEIYNNEAQIRKQSTDQLRETGSFGTGTYRTVYTEGGGSYQVENYRQLSNNETEYIAEVANELQESLGGVAPTAEQLRAELQRLSGDGQLGADALNNLSSIITDSTITGFVSLGDSVAEVAEANKYYAEQILKIGIEENYGDKIQKLATDEEGNVNQALVGQITQAFTNRAAQQAEEEGRRIDEEYAAVEDDVKDIVNTGDLNDFLDNYTDEEIKAVLGDDYDGDIGNDKELGLMYASMLTGDDISTLTYKAGTGKGTVTDAKGNKVFEGVSDEVMRREIAKQVAMSSITAKYTQGVSGETKTAEELAKLETALGNIISGGSEAAEKYGADFSTAILNSIANEDFESLDFSSLFTELTPQEIEELSGLDKDGILSMLGISEQDLIDAGYNVDTFVSAFGSALDEWTYQLDTSGLEEKASSLNDIIDGLKTGSIVEEETILKLQEMGINIDDYFTKMADGSYQLVGIAEDLVNILKSNIQQDYINKILEVESAQSVATNKVNEQYGNSVVGTKWNDTSVTMIDGMGTNTQNLYQARRDYINEAGGASVFGFTEDQTALLEKSSWTWEEMQELNAMFETATQSAGMLQEQLFSTATSLQELDNLKGSLDVAGVEETNYNAYAEALIGLGSAYENCAEEIENYNLALASGNEQEVIKAEAVLRSSIAIGEAAEKYDLSAESLEAQTREIMIANNWGEEYAEIAASMAISNQRMNKGLTKLVNGWKDWKKTLKSTDNTSQDYADTLVDLSEAVSDLVGAYDDLSLSSTFVEENMDLIESASTGNINAIMQLGAAVASYQVGLAKLDETMSASWIDPISGEEVTSAFEAYRRAMGEATDSADAFAAAQSGVQAGFDLIKNNITSLSDGSMSLSEVLGGEQGLQDWINNLNAYASATGMTAQEMQEMLSSVGVTANVQEDYQEQDVQVPTYIERSQVVGWDTYSVPHPTIPGATYNMRSPQIKRSSTPGKPETHKGWVAVASISMDGEGETPSVSPPTFTGRQAPSASAVSGGNTGGGGGGSSHSPSTTEKREPTQKSDVVERYREINDAIDNVTDALTRAERATDRLWGKDKLAAMREENKILEEQKDLILEKAKEAEEYAKEDAKNLRNVAKDIGVSVVIDQETGDITNIEDVEETLYNRLAAAEAEYNAKVDAYNKYVESLGEKPTEAQVDQAEKMKDALDAYEEDIIGKIEKDIEAWEDAEQQFQESVETWEDAGLEAEEILDQIMQNNYDIIMEGLEIPLSLNEEDLRLLELQLAQIEDDVYSMAEAVALTSSQFGEYQDNLRLADEALEELNKARELGKQGLEGGITEAAYQEGLAEIRDKYYENIEALMELDKTMEEYYGNTIDMANEELSKYTDQMEHQTSVLEHYQSLIELMGKSGDYKMMGKVLEGQVETTKNALDVSRNWYETQRANADSLAAEYAAAQARGASEAELEIIKANWDAAEAAANEAQEQMLSDAEAWAEALKAVLENKLADLGQTLENALTGGTSFDALTTQMERANSLQEDYLTTTNQIYETNKLMRTAQQEIDKTTNSAAKKRLQAYINETQQLQDQSKLSQYELEIQQAKYDLLLAEIALEEAQDAKSTVRLQRDAEGNFGYVYTADQNKLAEAEQQLADAQNNLYNIGLEGANDYASKYQETLNEMYDTLADLQQQYLDGSFESEAEYQQAMEEAKAYYYQKLQDYSSLYSVALTTDSRVVADAWSTDFNDMIYKTDEWMSAVDAYADGAIQAFREWQSAVTGPDGVTTIVGSSIEEVGNNVQDVTDKSKALADTVNDDVIPALDNQLDSVQNLTGAYAALRDTIQEIIEEYNLMISSINGEQQSKWDNGDSGSGSGNSSSDEDGSSGSGDSSSSGNADSGTGGAASEAGVSAPVIEVGKKVQVKTTATHFSRDGGNGTKMKSFVPGSYYTVMDFDDDEVKIGKNNAVTGWVNKTDLVGFRTGGYTGTWEGSYGKLAFLHQKEMVLNAQDTENLLSSMELLNQILEMIDLQSASAQLGGLLSTPGFNNSGLQSIEQNVHIEASFPGVQDRSEIEEAFNNLINQASQYANRK